MKECKEANHQGLLGTGDWLNTGEVRGLVELSDLESGLLRGATPHIPVVVAHKVGQLKVCLVSEKKKDEEKSSV